jgi:hypothetical protein
MAGVYSELRGFVLAHRRCTGPRHDDVDPLTPQWLPAACQVWLRRRVQAVGGEDADEDLLRSALLAFEN